MGISRFVPVAFVVLLGACLQRRYVPCVADSNCNLSPGGVCTANDEHGGGDWCAYPDGACPSGYRYSDQSVGDGVSGMCTMPPVPGRDGGPVDSPIDSSLGRCNTGGAFQAPTLVPVVNSALGVFSISMNSDETIAVFTGTENGTDFVPRIAKRATLMDNFSMPTSAGDFSAITNGAGNESFPSISPDGLVVYFVRATPATFSTAVYYAERSTINDAFPVGGVIQVDGAGLSDAAALQVSNSGQTLYWRDDVDFKLRSAAKGGANGSFFLRRAESTMSVGGGFALSADELTLYYGSPDILISRRSTKQDLFGPGTAIAQVNSSQDDRASFITADGCILYIVTQRAGGVGAQNVWAARRPL